MELPRRLLNLTSCHPAPRLCCLGSQLVLLTGLVALTACAPVRQPVVSGGQLYVNTDPEGAAITCDNRVAPKLSPTTLTGLAAGDHLIIANKIGFAETRVTTTIQAGERLTLDLKLDPIQGLVLIHSTPQGADVEIDSSNYGKTPLLIPHFPLGRHRVTLSSPSFMAKTVDVTVADRTPQVININLKSDFAKVLFESKPAGAQVTIDGTAVGRTPCEAPRIASGKHRLSIAHKGYLTHDAELTVQPGEERTQNVNLTARPGQLSVVSIPPKARFYLNGQYKSETPFIAKDMQAGAYTLRVELPGYAVQSRTITLGAGAEASEEFMLVKNSGTILLSTEPAEVTVFLDDENRGITHALNQKPISTQFTIDLVPKGSHKLQLSKSGYFAQTSTVKILNQTLILHCKMVLRPVRFVPNTIIHTGPGAEYAFRGIIRGRFANGDIKLEIEPGIFKTFKASEIQSTKPIVNP